MGGVATAAHLCTAVFDGDLQLLRRLLRAGANPNAVDYDKRSALHIAAADGNLPVVSLYHFHFVNCANWFLVRDFFLIPSLVVM